MKARVVVTLKSGVLDPQGKAIEGALSSLGIGGIASVRQGKVFDVEVAENDPAGAEAALAQACEKLLANTVIENYRIDLEAGAASAAPPQPDPPPPPADVAPEAPAAPPSTEPAVTDVTEIAARDTDMPTEGHP